MSPMIHSMLRSKEAKEAREESKAIPIMTQSNTPQRAAIQEIMQALDTPAASIEPPKATVSVAQNGSHVDSNVASARLTESTETVTES